MTATYSITTWDTDLQEFTPQIGCPETVTGPAELRDALRLLRSMGYDVQRANAHSVLVERVEA